jgi:hypothetical protein
MNREEEQNGLLDKQSHVSAALFDQSSVTATGPEGNKPNHFKHDVNLINILQIQFLIHIDILRLHYKGQLIFYMVIIGVYFRESYWTHKSTLEQNSNF